MVLHIGKLTSVADYLVICSGDSERQIRAIAEHIDHTLAVQRVSPLSIEGTATARWILIDFGDVVAHVFLTNIRTHYGLEKLWGDAQRVPLTDDRPLPPLAPPRPARKRSTRARKQR